MHAAPLGDKRSNSSRTACRNDMARLCPASLSLALASQTSERIPVASKQNQPHPSHGTHVRHGHVGLCPACSGNPRARSLHHRSVHERGELFQALHHLEEPSTKLGHLFISCMIPRRISQICPQFVGNATHLGA